MSESTFRLLRTMLTAGAAITALILVLALEIYR